MKSFVIVCLTLCALSAAGIASADGTRADSHAPIGVMGDHFHKAGEWMFSYRYMAMSMEGNRKNSSRISPDTIVTTEPNIFAGMPGMPPTLRVVPTEMEMGMHMLGLMYAPSDRITLMLMANYIDKDMTHITYQGGAGTTVLGSFTTKTSGWGDTTVSGLIRLLKNDDFRLHAIVGLSLPTGSTDETGEILTPANTRPTVRLPYPMQLGSGTYDPILGLSYAGFAQRWAWGAQWRSIFRIADNDDDYQLGSETRLTGWLSFLWDDAVSASIRAEYSDRGNVSGMDPLIMAPVQTADPARQGGARTDIALGMNFAGQHELDGWRLAVEYSVPVQQRLDGPQLEADSRWIVGIQKSW